MSDLTDALSYSLQKDLEGYLDPYQINLINTGAELWPDATPREAAAWYLAHSLFKKYNDKDRPGAAACDLALAKFLECNESNASYSATTYHVHEDELINAVSDELYNFWYVGEGRCQPLISTLNEVYERGRLGNGSNRAARGRDFYTKVYDSPLSYVSEDLCFSWQKLVANDPRHLLAEQMRSCRYGFHRVQGNALSFVNKNVTVARGICTEPTINMWFQLGTAAILTERLKSRYDVSLDVQPEINRAMARTGSITGRFATIDMESASDLISLNMARRVFPKGMLNWLMLFRSPTTTLPSGVVVELHSVSTMGNGFTFPMMTALFCAVITSVYRRLGIPVIHGNSLQRSFSVFGDDLIIVPEAVRLVYKVLELLGFRINKSKSYVEGPFRESCGSDYFSGHPVRGIYIKRLHTAQDYTVAINGLNHWSAYTGIFVPNLVGHLVVLHKKLFGKVLYGPADESDDACVRVPIDTAPGVRRMQFGLVRYRRWHPCTVRLTINSEKNEISVVGNTVARQYNPEGLYLAFLYGAVRGGSISIQADRVRYQPKQRVSATWDSFSPQQRRTLVYDWRQWSTAVRYNLSM